MTKKSFEDISGFQPVGEEKIAYTNQSFSVVEQAMDFIDPATGQVRRSGGRMNYVRMGRPGSLIVAMQGDSRTGSAYLVQQERYPVNVTFGGVHKHWELPGGGLDDQAQEPPTPEDYLRGARKELLEEAGLVADEDQFTLVGPPEGQFPHPSMTDRNACVVVQGARFADGGAQHEDTEVISGAGFFTWKETRQMYLGGLAVQGGNPLIISSEPTIAKLNMAQQWLAMQEEQAALNPTIFT